MTVMHVPNLVWVVIEDAGEKTKLVTNLLKRCRVTSVHLNIPTSDFYRKDPSKPRGVEQRNAGLSWIRDHHTKDDCNGVVYFGDDDNSYDLRIFDEVMIISIMAICVHFAAGSTSARIIISILCLQYIYTYSYLLTGMELSRKLSRKMRTIVNPRLCTVHSH